MSLINVLIFHRIVKYDNDSWTDVKLCLLESLLANAVKNRKHVVTIDHWRLNNSGDLALSFDDGYLSDYDIVFPLLKKFDFHATFFVVPEFVGKEGYMKWEQVKEMSDSGMEIGSHSLSHKYLTALSDQDMIKELQNSKNIIESHISKEVTSFSCPYGDYSGKVYKFATMVGYKNICNSSPGLSHAKKKVISRNSINSTTKTDQLGPILNPDFLTIFKRKAGYFVFSYMKKILGVNNYLRLRRLMFGS